MEKYLFALDLDGTLLQDWQTITQETIDYLKAIQKEGHKVVLATGRPFRSSEAYYDVLELDTPIINYNGGLVTSKHDPYFNSYSLTVDLECILDIFEQNRKYIQNAFGEVGDDIYLLEDTPEIQPLLHNFNGARLFVGEFKDTLKHPTNGFIIIANKGQGHYIEEYVTKHYSNRVLHRNWGNEYTFIIELFTPETSKGNALEYVCNYLGFDKKHTVAIGDAHNDIEMIEYAHLGVAMKNAHPSLLEVANVITNFDNHENGVVNFIRDFLEKQKVDQN